ncbi:uncharacterized protein LOC9653703 [Selaginella moellendorffii]|uniref:uncharacterized protein LOC9653703 n=1 Tax=Selaginella moellendorffii TaxID=88036 RepID=UPI000D1CB01C|nr:uncharacterized protein LOC9653703 [Selaginella moellendorffii]|eukprot:XP_024539194.1 uncharacterized protein LOC9653703 [Selaginella moellendorffii]
MLQAYAVNNKPGEALELFQRATTRNAVSWNIVLNAHASFYGALPCFMRYPCWDSYSTTILRHFAIAELKAAVASSDLSLLEDVRAQYFKAFCYDDGYVDAIIRSTYTSLMHSLGTHGHLVDVAENVYKRIPSPDAAAFNALLAVYVKNGYYSRAQKLFAEGGGDRIDTRSFNIMISSLPLLEDSEALFERAREKDVFTWTSLASADVQNNRPKAADLTIRKKASNQQESRFSSGLLVVKSLEQLYATSTSFRMPRTMAKWSSTLTEVGSLQRPWSLQAVCQTIP